MLAPTLPGHGGEPDDLIGVDWETWLAAAREWPADGPADIVVGQSMGALLAFALAAEGRAGAVVAINPPAPDPDAIDGMLPHGAVHQGLAVRSRPLEPQTMEEACFPADDRPVVILDQVTDPQNVGAVFRSAAAFGARAIILQDRKSPPLTGALAKAAAGAVDTIPHVRVVNLARALAELEKRGYLTVGLSGEAETDLAQALDDHRPIALALGAEGKGLRDLVAATCERSARIPIAPDMESLNVSVAAAIALYETRRRLSGPGKA